jgi:KaiC/GvpD/RAD55 family RecA-like ATPase
MSYQHNTVDLFSQDCAPNSSTQFTKPAIWVDGDAAIHALTTLSIIADIRLYNQQELSAGRNYFIADYNTQEWQIKTKAYQNPGNCYIYKLQLNQPLEYLIGEAVTAKAFFVMMLDHALPFADWCEVQDDEKISIKEATEIAKIVRKYLKGSELKTELETLRSRCNMSSYDWNKLMADLEAEFNQELERRGITTNPTDEAEILKLEIKRLNAEKDEAKKALIAKELRKQGISNQDIKAIASQIDNSFNTPKAKFISGKDFLSYAKDHEPWLIPGLLPATGCTILAGDPGIGKSTLAYDCAFSIISGQDFLGELPTKKGKVLIVCGDEPLDQLKDKMIDRGYFGLADQWDILYDFDISQAEILEEKIEDLRPTFLIIDSFSSIHQSDSFDENSSQSQKTIRKLNRLAERYNLSILMIHHTNKNKDQKGVHKLRGSSAIAAAAAAVWMLSGEGDVRTFTTPKLRNSEKINYNIGLNFHNGKFNVVSGNELIQESKPVIARVKGLFERSGHNTRLEFMEVRHEVGGTDDSIRKALQRLHSQGVLVKTVSKINPSIKVWYLSPKYVLSTPPLPQDFVNLSNEMAENHIMQGVEALDKPLDKPLDNHWTTIGQDTQKIPCPMAENNTEQTIGQPLDNIHLQSGGGGVVQSIGEETNITITDSVATAEVQEPIKVGDKVLVPHPQANEQGERVRETGDGWVMVDFFPKKFPLDDVIRL